MASSKLTSHTPALSFPYFLPITCFLVNTSPLPQASLGLIHANLGYGREGHGGGEDLP